MLQHLWLPSEQVPCADPSPAVLELELAVQPLHTPIVPPLAVVPHCGVVATAPVPV